MTQTRRPLSLAQIVRSRLALFLGLALTCLALGAPLLAAVDPNCDRNGCGRLDCAAPAHPVPATLWGDLQPVDSASIPAERDASSFREFLEQYASDTRNWYFTVDVENGYLFTGTAWRLIVWDARTNPASPTRLGHLNIAANLIGPESAEEKLPMRAADAPAGSDDTVAYVGVSGTGLLIVDTADKAHPRLLYWSHKKSGETVYAATIGGRQYAFMGATSGDAGPGLFAFDMTAARTVGASGACRESAPAPAEASDNSSCPGVFLGKFKSKVDANRASVFQVDGVDNYIVLSFGSQHGWEIWDVSNPASPTLKLSGEGDRSVFGVSLWKDGSRYLLASRSEVFTSQILHQTTTFDVSCITGTCGAAPAPLRTMVHDSGTANGYLSFSRSNGTPFLYLGSDNRCTGGIQHEWLLDVSNPAAPTDITPQGTTTASGTYLGTEQTVTYGYWGHYYRGNPTGFNLVGPRGGKFNGDYFYRAALSLFDIHKRTTASPPLSDFTFSPVEVYPGTPVTFTDRSSGAPNLFAWTFQDGAPPSSSSQNPVVSFGSTGAKTVTLTATNNVGAGSLASKTVTVLPPAPVIGSVSASPANPIVCQSVTFSASGVTGQPPLTYGWVLKNDTTTGTVASGAGTTLTWSTVGAPPGSYTATLTVSNSTSSAIATKTITLGGLLPLAFSGLNGAPTNDAFTNGTVNFHANSVGATEWSWNYGDGTGFKPYTSDPVAGPDPTFTYTATGLKSVQVKIRNCVQAEIASAVLPITITQTTPLIANFAATGIFCSGFGCFGTVSVPIGFTDASTGAEFWDYDWNGDGDFTDATDQQGLTAPATSHTYSTEGSFAPILRVRRGASEQATFAHGVINVAAGGPPPTPTISIGAASGNVNTPVTLTAFASNCTPGSSSWSWSVSGATVTGASNQASITLTWSTAGSKSVTATNSGCSGAIGIRSISISESNTGGGTLQAAFVFTPGAPKIGEAVSFNGTSSTGSPTGYTWHFGDGSDDASGSTVTHAFAAAGTYPVRLAVSKPGTGNGCLLGVCVSELTKNVVVIDATPPITADFSADIECTNQFGIEQCTGQTAKTITLTAVSVDAASYSWSFGDGSPAGSGRVVTHAWAAPNPYAVILTVTKGSQSATKSKVFNISGAPRPREKSVVLPWIAQTRGALVQSSDLWVFNPSANPIMVKCELRKRGLPDTNPPAVTRTVAAGAVLYAADAIRDLFGRENLAGFILCQGVDTDVEPVVTSINTTFQPDGKQFGQSIPGLSKDAATAAAATAGSSVQHLVGLNDTPDRLAYFGVSNPSSENAVYHVRVFDRSGHQVGESAGDLTLGQFGQRQFQMSEIRSLFGVDSDEDYRVEIETKSGGPVVPYAANLRLASGDPSFVEPRRTDTSKGYLVGIFSTPGLGGSKWQSDLVLANPGTQVATTDISFQGSGLLTTPTAPVHLTLQPGESQRLANVLTDKWGLTEAVGTLIFQSASPGGVFPIGAAEVYDNAVPTKRFGQAMAAQSDADAAAPGKSQFLVGLRLETAYRSTITLYNPSNANASFDLIYRGIGGNLLGTLSGRVLGAGKVQQINPSQHPFSAGGAPGGFSVEVKVTAGGSILSTAQVVNNLTSDPSFIGGRTR